jgi:hypothetical protein
MNESQQMKERKLELPRKMTADCEMPHWFFWIINDKGVEGRGA